MSEKLTIDVRTMPGYKTDILDENGDVFARCRDRQTAERVIADRAIATTARSWRVAFDASSDARSDDANEALEALYNAIDGAGTSGEGGGGVSDEIRQAAERLLKRAEWNITRFSGDVSQDTRDTLTVARFALAAGAEPTAPDARDQVIARLEAIVKEAWRFWADIGISPPLMLDRGFRVIRVHPERLAAFDALFRTSAALAPAEAGDASGEGDDAQTR